MIDENLCFASAFEHRLITLQEDYMSIIMDDISYADVKEQIWKDRDYILIYRELSLKKPFVYPTTHKNGLLKIQFELEGYSSYIPIKESDSNLPIEIRDGQFNLFYMPYVRGDLHYTVDRRCIDLMLPLDFLSALELVCPLIRERFDKAVAQGKGFKLFAQAQPIPFKVRECLKEIIDNTMPASLSRSYFRVKVREIILLILLHYYEMSPDQDSQPPEVRGAEKASFIKQWILRHLHEPIDIDLLCKQFNSNPTTLGRIFKQHFNCSVKKFVCKHRMEWALHALGSGDYSIKEIAGYCRYEYPHHFTHAFKKHFGKTPREIKLASKEKYVSGTAEIPTGRR
ncbi:helix-turn-helix transcriptional regulator [Sphingobacterium sp. N143]|uniref:helix-turn-helix domain-containing protein n=1 Tax=Sphingobacterium sp. N143 TaxID=2746727 RepID=UPI002575CBF7|nr:AraC family transcriptional regulator [Sphingobacterium sp. N143]MDM1296709.1 helix-turn-helix transcriptional regulator [Sphingobacterium sp. N143]